MRNDPREMQNLYADPKYAPVARDLKAQLEKLQWEAGDSPA
jgi:hypothetical protein